MFSVCEDVKKEVLHYFSFCDVLQLRTCNKQYYRLCRIKLAELFRVPRFPADHNPTLRILNSKWMWQEIIPLLKQETLHDLAYKAAMHGYFTFVMQLPSLPSFHHFLMCYVTNVTFTQFILQQQHKSFSDLNIVSLAIRYQSEEIMDWSPANYVPPGIFPVENWSFRFTHEFAQRNAHLCGDNLYRWFRFGPLEVFTKEWWFMWYPWIVVNGLGISPWFAMQQVGLALGLKIWLHLAPRKIFRKKTTARYIIPLCFTAGATLFPQTVLFLGKHMLCNVGWYSVLHFGMKFVQTFRTKRSQWLATVGVALIVIYTLYCEGTRWLFGLPSVFSLFS